MLILDSGGLGRLIERSTRAVALLRSLQAEGLWPPIVPSVVLVESLTGDARRDWAATRFLKGCDVRQSLPEALVRKAARLRSKARRGSAVDAVVVAIADPNGTVLTSDPDDLDALAAHAGDVRVVSA